MAIRSPRHHADSIHLRALVAALALLVTLGSPKPVAAQLTPADSASVLLQAAVEFEAQGQRDVAVAIYAHILDRYPGTPAAAVARERTTDLTGDLDNRMSRAELPVFGAVYGLWLGIAVPAALGQSEPEAYGVGLLLGAPLGLIAGRQAANRRPMSLGQARAISWGGTWGTWQGYGIAEVLDIGEEETCFEAGCFDGGGSAEERLTGMILGGLGGIVVGAVIARNPVGSGTSSAAMGGSMWGSVYGAMAAEMFDPTEPDATVLTSLIAGNVGLLAGVAAARKYEMSRPRVRMISLGALVGGLGGLGVDLILQPDSEATALGIPLFTSIGGLLFASWATRDYDALERSVPDDAGGALFAYRDGALTVRPPLPAPTLIPVEDVHGRTAWRPGLSFTLLDARF